MDKSNRHFSTKFLSSSTQRSIALKKNAVFSTSLIIVGLSFWVVATKAFSRSWNHCAWVAFSSLDNQSKTDCIHCDSVAQSNRRHVQSNKNAVQDAFYDFHSGNQSQYETECPWPTVCDVIIVRTQTLRLTVHVDQAS